MKQRAESAASEDFIVAKVRGMRSKLFEGSRLAALADSKSLPELFRRVRAGDTFEDHLAFERDLLADQVRDLDKISRHLSGHILRLVQWLLVHFELENLKVVLRAYLSKKTLAETEAVMAPVPAWLALPVSRLFDAPDLRRFAAASARRRIPRGHAAGDEGRQGAGRRRDRDGAGRGLLPEAAATL